MSLLSLLFGGDQQLLAAATRDAGHIIPGARGPHVGKIQEALNRLDGAKLTVDSQYGPKTAAAVAAFKTKRNILNTAGKIDNIVGIKTMAALDSEVLAKERGGGGLANIKPGVFRAPGQPAVVVMPSFQPNEVARSAVAPNTVGRRFGVGGRVGDGAGDPSLQSLNPLKVVPFNEPPNSFILAKSVDDPNKSDLDTRSPPRKPLTGVEQFIINDRRFQFKTAAFTNNTTPVAIQEREALDEAQKVPDSAPLMRRFFTNTNPNHREVFDVGSGVSNRIANSQGFATEHNGVVSDITQAIQAQFLTGTIDYRLMRGFGPQSKKDLELANPNGVKDAPSVGFKIQSEPLLLALIGSFQGATVILKNFSVDAANLTFRATLRYELIDHFGVDNSDVVPDLSGHGTSGQVAFWLLQHETPVGHTPFRIVVIVEKDISDSLLNPGLFPQGDLLELLRQLNGKL
jgi:Putative peptidoglycan binding domain